MSGYWENKETEVPEARGRQTLLYDRGEEKKVQGLLSVT